MNLAKTDLTFNNDKFQKEYLHNSYCECPYCFLGFPHLHKEGTNLNQFYKITPKEESWEDRFDEEFKNLELDPERRELSQLKDFIRREFL